MRTWTTYLLLALVGLYVTWGSVGTVALWMAGSAAERDVEDRTATAEHFADRARDDSRRVMRQPPPVDGLLAHDPRPLGAPSYSWREASCEVRSIDSGWIAVDFERVCEMRDVDLYRTPGPPGRCVVLPAGDLVPDDPRPEGWETPVTRSVTVATSDRLQGGPRRAVPCVRGIAAPPPSEETVLLSGRRPTRLPSRTSWVVVTRTDEFSRTPLGCHPWVVVLCAAPPRAG